jgi:hypothetical protein
MPAKTKTARTTTKPIHVVAFSNTRDIWYGVLESSEPSGPGLLKVTLTSARHCYYYAAPTGATKGVGSLGVVGPVAGSRIGPPVKRMTMVACCGLLECDEAAVKAWEAATWAA